MTTPKDAVLSIRLSATDRDKLAEIAAANDEPVAQTARRAIRAFIATAGALLAILAMTACGTDEPAAQPTVTVTVDERGQVVEPTAAPTVEATEDCWTETTEWQVAFNATGADPEARVVILEALPDPAEGCEQADVERLMTFDAMLVRIKALPTG